MSLTKTRREIKDLVRFLLERTDCRSTSFHDYFVYLHAPGYLSFLRKREQFFIHCGMSRSSMEAALLTFASNEEYFKEEVRASYAAGRGCVHFYFN